MKFLADGMLGKLTRWLRMLGQDVRYSVQFDDSELLVLAKKEERVLLTKDLELISVPSAKVWMLTLLRERLRRSGWRKSPNVIDCSYRLI